VDGVATGGRVPDRTLLFDLPAEEARARGHSPSRRGRGAADRLDAEGLAFYERVRRGFLEISQSEPERFRTVDSSGGADITQERVRAELGRWLGVGVEV
jgi:dTMP kinase